MSFQPYDDVDHSALGLSVSLESKTGTLGAIKNVFARNCPEVKADAALASRLIQFQIAFINKNQEHIEFFGGNLTGVQVVRFTPQDMSRFFTDVVKISEYDVIDDLHAVPAVVPHRKISGDVFNHTCLWLVHLFLSSTTLKEDIRHRAALAAALILEYRFLTSLLAWYYKFPANPEVAQAAYAQLSGKYLIKQAGNWQTLLEWRAKDWIEPEGLHHITCMEYENDDNIIYALNDFQNRIRDIMKNLIAELKRVAALGTKVRTSSAMVEIDGEVMLRDRVKSLSTYIRYMHSIVPDRNTFIKSDIIDILAESMHTAPPPLVEKALEWCCQHYRTAAGKEIEELIDATLVHSFNYLNDNRTVMKDTNDLPGLIMRLRGVYMSSRSTEVHLMHMRDLAETIVKKAVPSKNQSLISAVKTALMLYLVIRAFTMTHYGVKR